MKTWTLKLRATDKEIFDEIKDGLKVVETRAATVKYQPVAVGDVLIFSCGKEKLSKTVTKKHHFPSVDAMVKKIPYKKIMPTIASVADMKKVYSSYPGYDDKIKESGIFAFEMK